MFLKSYIPDYSQCFIKKLNSNNNRNLLEKNSFPAPFDYKEKNLAIRWHFDFKLIAISVSFTSRNY